MVNIHLISNCQVDPTEYLIEHMIPSARVKSIDISPKNRHSEEQLLRFCEELKDADLILAQARAPLCLHPDFVKKIYPDKTLAIANLYFRGLHPDNCYLGEPTDHIEEPSTYHSLVVIDAFKRGLSQREASLSFTYDNYKRLGFFQAWESSITELEKRDLEIDVPAAALVDSFCREAPGFLTVNHPTVALMHAYLSRVFEKANMKTSPLSFPLLKDPLATQDVMPIYDEVAEHYHLPYRTTQHWMIHHLGNKFVARDEFVRRSYECYRQTPMAKLYVHSPVDFLSFIGERTDFKHLLKPNDGRGVKLSLWERLRSR